ncbi:hypothetical protein QQX98_010495 [Neonectria punicea]|uniref:Uncharacterized protein n=1 Tax=Neonectria punicea TaxID=979145 RepID=A0ABR1GPC2_9HYPO
MASAESSVELIRKAILENGFYFSKDTTVGERVEKMDEDATPFASAGGLQFCKVNVLDNPCIRPVLDSFFEWFGLGLYRSFGARPGDYTFRKSDPESEVDCLLVHLLRKGSMVTFWGGSHGHLLPSIKGENNLLLVPRAFLRSLRRHGVLPTKVLFEHGGL